MSAEEKAKKPRPIWMKKGSYKYLLQLLHSIKRDLSDLRKTQRHMAKGLEHEFLFDEDYIRDITCSDEIDQAILNILRHAPDSGILPRDIAREVQGVTPWQVTLRMRRMNKRLDKQIGQKVAEKRGLQWALTSFAEAASELTREEIDESSS
ncbi:MAG: hypothetical protein ACE5NG_09780 [bacterium]